MLSIKKIENKIVDENSVIFLSILNNSICSIGETLENDDTETFKGFMFAECNISNSSKLHINNFLKIKVVYIKATDSAKVKIYKINSDLLNLNMSNESKFNIKENSIVDQLVINKRNKSEINCEKITGGILTVYDNRLLSLNRLKNIPYENFGKVYYLK